MHPEVTSDQPGRCPKCGMNLVPTPAPAATTTAYACPMHPEVTSDQPGRCPKCGMNLVGVDVTTRPASQQADEMHHDARNSAHQDEGVRDVVTLRQMGSSGKARWSRSTA